MGKGVEDEEAFPATVLSITSQQSAVRRRWGGCNWCCCCCCGGGGGGWGIGRHFGVKCGFVLFLSAGVFLSAVFWLAPFLHFADQDDLDLDPRYRGHDIVAYFHVEKPVAFLEENIVQLQDDILGEIDVATIKVSILSVEQVNGLNASKVVFAIDSDTKNSKISSAVHILIRESFESFVTQQVSLRLTASLFGDAFSFEVLKFVGGITIIPPQSAFLLQKVQILFNFTLNYPVEQVQANFADLTSQLKSGLRLTSYENLYISLSNSRGSTVAPPVIVQSSVLLAVGNTPSMLRLKQLAQTITGSHSGNLGLDNTIFGRVKQVQLSSILQHSLNGSDQGLAPSPSPTYHPHHHHSQHRHHGHLPLAPAISPAPATHRHRGSPAHHHMRSPTPEPSHEAKPPECQYGHKEGFPKGRKRQSAISPAPAPSIAYGSPISSPTIQPSHPRHLAPPSHSIAATPLTHVSLTHSQPPSSRKTDAYSHRQMPAVAPSPLSSSSVNITIARGALLTLLAIALRL